MMRILPFLALVPLASMLAPAGSASRAEVTAEAALAGAGESAWGAIALPDSTNSSVVAGKPRPTWERIANFPYNIAFLPVKALCLGVEAAAEAVDEKPALKRLVHLFPLSAGPALVSGGVSFDTGDGFGANLSIDVPDFGERHDAMKLRLAGRTRGERRATLAFRFPRSEDLHADAGGGYRSEHNARFYGIGPDAPEEDESFHRREIAWAGVTLDRRLGSGGFRGKVSGIYSSVGATGSDHSDRPHVSEVFGTDRPFGYRERSEGVGGALEVVHESGERLGPPGRSWPDRLRPECGGLRRAFVSWFEGKGNQRVRYWTWRAEAQQFVPLPHSRRALALRAFVTRQENEGDDPIPFQRLQTNDDPDVLRGYPDGRFHDVGLAAATAEYRWPLWVLSRENGSGLDAYVFADAGQVFSALEQIDADHLTESWGCGLRLGGYGRFTGRAEIGHSEEGTQFRLRADQVLQFERGGLFFGRSPVPER